MRLLGQHLRFYGSYRQLFDGALNRGLDTFQVFFLHQTERRYVALSAAERQSCLAIRRERFSSLYVHGSYVSNIAGYEGPRHTVLERELELAQRLEFTHFVIHPGAWMPGQERIGGIDRLASVLNDLYRRELSITIVLENTAHGGRCLGGDLDDFQLLRERITYPEKLKFCLDSAHAHSYGYDMKTEAGRQSFFQHVEKAMGLEHCLLLHVNDSKNEAGSGLDQHEAIGYGRIGYESLRSFAMHPGVGHLPIILEMPDVTDELEQDILKQVRGWKTE